MVPRRKEHHVLQLFQTSLMLYSLYSSPPHPSLPNLSRSPSLNLRISLNQTAMARLMLLVALCVLPALVSAARPASNPFIVQGRVYCDTCRAGFETSATTYISGARVRVECKDRNTAQLLYSIEGKTDSTGTYKIMVTEDHEDQVCDAVLVSSSQTDCASADPGRDRARVILTRYNGIVSDNRFANSMGFMKDQPLSGCTQLLKQYQEYDE